MEPIIFGLLWEHQIETLKPLLTAIAAKRDAVLTRWWELYSLHFGSRKRLSHAEFIKVHGADLDATVETLIREDFGRFVVAMREIGMRLADLKVPFAEVVASLHLFEEAAIAAFPHPEDSASERLFDRVNHCRIAVLAESYFRAQNAVSAAQIARLGREIAHLRSQTDSQFHGIVGASPVMRALYQRIEEVAAVPAPVLVAGENGTGNELAARAIHECSSRRRAPFVMLDCAALPRELIESELFGYRREVFGDSSGDSLGLFRAAGSGTLFINEIAEMSPETQRKLLRSLSEGTICPVGSAQAAAVDVRVVVSTNRNTEEALRSGALCEDLYFRLSANALKLPPLRERLDDLPPLVDHFVTLFNERSGRNPPVIGVDEAAMEAMRRYHWPGNVRELSDAIEQAFTFCRSDLIGVADLPAPLARAPGAPRERAPSPAEALNLNIAEHQRDLIERALALAKGNKLRAAKLLGISRKALYAKLRRYGMAGEIRQN